MPTLKRVFSAGAPVPSTALERFSRMLPSDANIFTTYGATEALPVTSIESREILSETAAKTDTGAGVCVGRPVQNMEVHIIPISDEAIPNWNESQKLPDGDIGEIVARGKNVTHAYFNRDHATQLAKIHSGDSFFHRMGDLGYFDDQGRLWFCGRKGHRVETKSGTMFTIPCEAVFNTHPQVYRSALVGVKIRDEIQPVLCVELEKGTAKINREKIRGELLEIGGSQPHTSVIKTILFHKAFPVDIRHNSKIFREKLTLWAQKELS